MARALVWKTKGRWFDSISKHNYTWWNGRHGRLKIYSSSLGIGSSPIVGKKKEKRNMNNKSKKLLKLGNFIYGNKIQILLIDTDKLIFLKKYKNFNNLIKISLKDKRIYRLLFELLKYRIKYITY